MEFESGISGKKATIMCLIGGDTLRAGEGSKGGFSQEVEKKEKARSRGQHCENKEKWHRVIIREREGGS